MHGQSGQSRKRNTAMGMGPPRHPRNGSESGACLISSRRRIALQDQAGVFRAPTWSGANGPDRAKLIGVFRGAPSGGRRKRCVWTADCVCVREGTSDLARNRVISCLIWTGSTKIIPSNFYGNRKVNRTTKRSYRIRVLCWLAGWFPLSGFGFSRGKRGRGTGREGGKESDLLSSPACAAVDLVSSSLHSVDARPPAR